MAPPDLGHAPLARFRSMRTCAGFRDRPFQHSRLYNAVFSPRGGTSRLEIWRVALQALLEHPWIGIGPDFGSYWETAQPARRVKATTHAHNLWLAFAAAYGLPGLFAILWVTGGFLLLAWRWGRWRALALVVSILIMNLFDYTLFYSGVLFPLLLGLNALRNGGCVEGT